MKNINIDAVLIDDDQLIHDMWEYIAIKCNKKLYKFKTPEQFFLECSELPVETPIYIDSNLANGIKGEIVAEKIYLNGISFTSGHIFSETVKKWEILFQANKLR